MEGQSEVRREKPPGADRFGQGVCGVFFMWSRKPRTGIAQSIKPRVFSVAFSG